MAGVTSHADFDVAYARAKAAWPDVEGDRDELAAYVEQRAAPDDDLARLRIDDLYLACACVRGQPRAIEAFMASYGVELEAAVQRMPDGAMTPADLHQALREKLFTGAIPKI